MLTTTNYLVKSFAMLPNPRGIPFHLQGMPVPDGLQHHASGEERAVLDSDYARSNNLPLGRFLGTVWPQQHQPKFLGANERIVFEGTW